MIGLQKITVPLRANELTLENITEYLQSVYSAFEENSTKISDNYNFYKGEHSVLQKKRRYEDDEINNAQVVNQYIWFMVNFKCGYAYGRPLEFARKEPDESQVMPTFNKYLSEINFAGLTTNLAEWVYATGVAYAYTQPYKSEDKNNIPPFKCYHIESNRCTKVYSSYIGNEPLFDMIVTPINKYINGSITQYNILSIYTKNQYWEFEYTISPQTLNKIPVKSGINNSGMLPLTEFFVNKDHIGISESCRALQDAIDSIDSDSVDNINDFVNQMLVLKNNSLGKTNEEKQENLRAAKKNGVIELFDENKDIQADIKSLVLALNYSDVNVIKNQLKSDMFGCWGVPLPSVGVSSGNITKSGSEITNGWNNSYACILKENNNMLIGLRSLISQFLIICDKMPDRKLNGLKIGDLEIKYNIARSDNLQAKTQSYTYLVENNVPPEIALSICELTSDPQSVGKRIEEYAAKKRKIEQEEKQKEYSRETDNIEASERLAKNNAQNNESELDKRKGD